MADQPQSKPNLIERWLFRIAAKKVAIGIVKFVTAVSVSSALEKAGVKIDAGTLGNVLPEIIFAGLVAAHDYLKLRFGWKWL